MGEQDIIVLTAVGALILSAILAVIKLTDKSPSLREHLDLQNRLDLVENGQRERPTAVVVNRDIDRIERRLDVIEQTRPTTGELEAKLDKKN